MSNLVDLATFLVKPKIKSCFCHVSVYLSACVHPAAWLAHDSVAMAASDRVEAEFQLKVASEHPSKRSRVASVVKGSSSFPDNAISDEFAASRCREHLSLDGYDWNQVRRRSAPRVSRSIV